MCDGFTTGQQESLRTRFDIQSSDHFRLGLNLWSTVLMALAALVSGELTHFISFATEAPLVILDIAIFAITNSLGQIFIFKLMTEFDTLVSATVTTTRKFFTIVFSVSAPDVRFLLCGPNSIMFCFFFFFSCSRGFVLSSLWCVGHYCRLLYLAIP